MLDENKNKKLKRLLYKRLGLGFIFLVATGFSVVAAKSLHNKLQGIEPTQITWVDKDLAKLEQDRLRLEQERQLMNKAYGLIPRHLLQLPQEFKQRLERKLEQRLKQRLQHKSEQELGLLQDLELSSSTTIYNSTVVLLDYQVLQYLAQRRKLELVRELEQELERKLRWQSEREVIWESELKLVWRLMVVRELKLVWEREQEQERKMIVLWELLKKEVSVPQNQYTNRFTLSNLLCEPDPKCQRKITYLVFKKEQIEQDIAQIQAEIKWAKVRRNKGFQFDVISLILSMLALVTALLFLIRIQNQTSLSFAGQLFYFLPEECVAELGALSQQLKSNNYPNWLIKMIIFKCFLELTFALYIQINIDNFRLPSKRK